jgi:GDP-D-mannose 3', 5'-epimerase
MIMKQKKAIVTGAGGFIGNHLVSYLKSKNYFVIGVDIKEPEFSSSQADEFKIADLRDWSQTEAAFKSADELYMLAADMGGVGYINTVNAEVARNNTLISMNSLQAAHVFNIDKVFFASSACVYPEFKQDSLHAVSLKESDTYPAQPDTPYGWEKLFAEQACLAFRKDYDMDIKIARFHNIYGPEGTFEGGREKSPAAICRKVAQAKQNDTIEVWGDGKQERSYCYIDDCISGIDKLMQSDVSDPINIGSDRLVSIDDLVSIVSKIADKEIKIKHDLTKPQGVRSRNADISMAKETLGWEPGVALEDGLRSTYDWILAQM